jgi:predicted nucleic acid-binding protein
VARLLVDTGFLVAAFRRHDELHADAVAFLHDSRTPLLTAAPVVAETCHFLDARGKVELLRWIGRGGLGVAEVPVEAYVPIAALIHRYRKLDIDYTDAALLWFADAAKERRILTVDERDFSAFRLRGNRSFELVRWHRGAPQRS